MFEELMTVDKIGRYYFCGLSLFLLFVAVSSITANTWFGVFFFVFSLVHFLAGIGLLNRKKWGLKIARILAGMDPFNRNPLSEWLANLKDNRLDQFFS